VLYTVLETVYFGFVVGKADQYLNPQLPVLRFDDVARQPQRLPQQPHGIIWPKRGRRLTPRPIQPLRSQQPSGGK